MSEIMGSGEKEISFLVDEPAPQVTEADPTQQRYTMADLRALRPPPPPPQAAAQAVTADPYAEDEKQQEDNSKKPTRSPPRVRSAGLRPSDREDRSEKVNDKQSTWGSDPARNGRAGRDSDREGRPGNSNRRDGAPSSRTGGGNRGGGGGRRNETAPPLEDCEPLSVNEETRWKPSGRRRTKGSAAAAGDGTLAEAGSKGAAANAALAPDSNSADVRAAVLRKARSILNKLTLEKFEPLCASFLALVASQDEPMVAEIVSIVVNKAQSERHFSSMYAELCLRLVRSPLPGLDADAGKAGKAVRRLLLGRCQEEFERDVTEELQAVKNNDKLSAEERRELEMAIKQRFTGHMRFIGELYKKELLKERHVCAALDKLWEDAGAEADEEGLWECYVQLWATVGRTMEVNAQDKEMAKFVKKHFKGIKKLGDSKDRASSRIRFLMQELVALRENDWVPRRAEEKAKTLKQVYQDIAREDPSKKAAVNRVAAATTAAAAAAAAASSGGGDGTANASSATSVANADDEWETVPTSGKRSNKAASADSQWASAGRTAAKAGSGGGGGDGARRQQGSSATGSAFAALGEDERKKRRDKDKDKDKKKEKDRQHRGARDKDRHKKERKAAAARPVPAGPLLPGAAAAADSRNGSSSGAAVSEEVVRRRSRDIFEEYVVNGDADEAAACFRELEAPEHTWAAAAECVSAALEGRDRERAAVLQLLPQLSARNVVSESDLAACLRSVMASLPDLEIDIPLAVPQCAALVGALLALGLVKADLLVEPPAELTEAGRAAFFAAEALAAAQAAALLKKSQNGDAEREGGDGAAAGKEELTKLEGGGVVTIAAIAALLPRDERGDEGKARQLLEERGVHSLGE